MANKKKFSESYYQRHKDEIKANYVSKRKKPLRTEEEIKIQVCNAQRTYQNTFKGMCATKVANYRYTDRLKFNTDKTTVTQKQMIDMIEDHPYCFYCGKTDIMQLGLDRIDNSKPHTVDNCVVCCKECNIERKNENFFEFCKKKSIFF